MAAPKKEEVFQAILLADNFGDSIFGDEAPLEREALFPLVNRNLIDYTLEALTTSGVQEIYLFISRNCKDVKAYLKASKWMEVPTNINVICSEDSQSVGDALRDLDARGIIRSDFVLMTAGVVTNAPIMKLMNIHKATVQSDKGALITLIQRRMSPNHRSKSRHSNPIYVVNSANGRLICYKDHPRGHKFDIPMEKIQKEMNIYMDSCDTGIAICSANVLPLFTDNFDFSSLSDFIKGILINEEIMGNSIYCHRLESGYANRLIDYDSYCGISLDILQRWSYPVVPDMPFGCAPEEASYSLTHNFIYKAHDVTCARNALLERNVIIGAGSSVGENSFINDSTIGRNNRIGKNVNLRRCQLGNDITIEDGVCLTECIVLDKTVIGPDRKVEAKSIVSTDTEWKIQEPVQTVVSDSDSESDEHDHLNQYLSSDDELVGHQEKDFKRFSSEVLETILRGFTDNVNNDNLALEIHGSRTANFVYFEDVTPALTKALMQLPKKLNDNFENFNSKTQWEQTKLVISKFKDLLTNYVKDEKNQKSMLKSLEEYANDNDYVRPMLIQILHFYYDHDILTEESILEWYETESLYSAGSEIRKSVQKLVDWLQEASEESDD